MKKHTLQASVRKDIGKTVKLLRAQGKLPATVYGKALKSISITVDTAVFVALYRETGETGLIELTVDGKIHPVLVHTVQVHPVTDALLHVEFHQVSLKEKIQAKVAVEQTGESPAVERKTGVLMTLHDFVEVEALPTDLPEKLFVDISTLTEVGQDIKAGSITLPSGVVMITEPTTIMVKIAALITKEAKEEVAADAAQAAEAEAEKSAEEEQIKEEVKAESEDK